MNAFPHKNTFHHHDDGAQMLGLAIIGMGLSLFWLTVGIGVGIAIARGALQ